MVIEIRGDKVRLKVDAPQSVRVDREEIRKAKDGEANA
jgi:carbon storage regulator CsrA